MNKLDFFDYVSQDVAGIVILFLKIEDIQSLRKVCKFFNHLISKDRTWKLIGMRDCPYLRIENEKEFYLKSPFFVDGSEIVDYIKKDSWALRKLKIKVLNGNGLPDHRVEAYVKSIVKNIIIVDKLRAFNHKMEIESQNEFMDRRICITKTIEAYSDLIEKEGDELDLWFKEK